MKQKNKFLLIVCLVIVIGGLFLWVGQEVEAVSPIMTKLKLTAGESGLPTQSDPVNVVALVIQGALGIVAAIFFIMIIIAGFRWMTAGGNEETVSNSKKNISNAIIGLIVILFSYAVTYFVFNILLSSS